MKAKIYLIFLFYILATADLKAQVGIGTNTPHESAQLEVSSDKKGILLPRLTETQKLAVANPAEGLLIYQTDQRSGFYYYQSGKWNLLSADSSENNQVGAMQYWNGGKWINVPTGTPGQLLQLSGSGVPKWVTTAYQPGDTGPAGGLIFYDKGKYEDGWRYLELAPEKLGKCSWGGCYAEEIENSGQFNDYYVNSQGLSIAMDGIGIGAGRLNTNILLAACPETFPVKLVGAYKGGGYTDWFLPSYKELEKLLILFQNRPELKDIFTSYEDEPYWTSSVPKDGTTMLIYGSIAIELTHISPDLYPVLAVRRF